VSAIRFLVLISLFFSMLLVACEKTREPKSHFVSQASAPGSESVIIFVHGILGDQEKTWVNKDTNASWPDMLAKDLSTYDVYVYGFYSPIVGKASDVDEVSTRMLRQLKDDGIFSHYESIYFITHSMGGNITKDLLNSLNTRREHAKLQQVRLVLYIAVPASGAQAAAIGDLVSKNPQFKSMSRESALIYLRDSEKRWQTTMRERTPMEPFPRAFIAYETRPWKSTVRVVPDLYTSGFSDDEPYALDQDHFSIVKPADTDAYIYKWAKARIIDASLIEPADDPDALPNLLPLYIGKLATTACEREFLATQFVQQIGLVAAQTQAIVKSGATKQNITNVSATLDNLKILINQAQLKARDVENHFATAAAPTGYVKDQKLLTLEWQLVRKSFEDVSQALPDNLDAKSAPDAIKTLIDPTFSQKLSQASANLVGNTAASNTINYSPKFKAAYVCVHAASIEVPAIN
jgi:hypothetical protein